MSKYARPWQHLYDAKWHAARNKFLRSNPLCSMCREDGSVVPATVVDHIIPHMGDELAFWDKYNWQPLCKGHHDSHKQRQERTGSRIGCDADGNPVDSDTW